ncbi:alkaline-phosphatase-like protein [Dipodascopsis tothii]|uniref:alkaline-phosphatase-like protein n=1 Tax=Dipodascopsis tothii TaxID=44089 RepID=UPI0034CF45E9
MRLFAPTQALAAVLALAAAATGEPETKPRNLIFILPDGYGPASETMARDYYNHVHNETTILPVDEMAVGLVRTKASDTLVTDSAASATAYSCGIKTYNGAIGVDDEVRPCGTVLEAAKLAGYTTGMVVTSRITHASPAGFAAHVHHRDHEAAIAEQLVGYSHPLGPVVDLMMGGGRCYFLPQSEPKSCRSDDLDLLTYAHNEGFTIGTTREDFDELQCGAVGQLPYMFLPSMGHLDFEADRRADREPSLSEMAKTAIAWLERESAGNDRGFFLFIEASRIDHAAHMHDPVGHVHDIFEYNKVMLEVREYVESRDDTTLVSAADHECGGLTLGVPDYAWHPHALASSSHSAAYYGSLWDEYVAQGRSDDDKRRLLVERIFREYGIKSPTEEEILTTIAATSLTIALGELLSARAGIHWSTLGHTAVDITLFAAGVNHHKLYGSWENIQLGQWMAAQLCVDTEDATVRLNSNATFLESIQPSEPNGTHHDHDHSFMLARDHERYDDVRRH